MNSFRTSKGNVWLENEELRPIYDFLKTHADLLDGSPLFEELLDAYNDSNDGVTDFKQEKDEEIEDLRNELEG